MPSMTFPVSSLAWAHWAPRQVACRPSHERRRNDECKPGSAGV